MSPVHLLSPRDIGRIVLSQEGQRNGENPERRTVSPQPSEHGTPQLFFVVWAIKGVYNCFMFVLRHDGQTTFPLSCSFKVRTTRDSFPQSRHL
jgi:hypothetical protein